MELGTIRNGTLFDRVEITRLSGRSSLEVLALFDRGHLLVFDVGGGKLGAVVHILADAGAPAIDLLAVDSPLRGGRVVGRMRAVAFALCEPELYANTSPP